MSGNFISELLQSITERGRDLLAKARGQEDTTPAGLMRLAGDLLRRRGEATGVALAEVVLTRYAQLPEEGRRDFLQHLAHDYGPDRERLERAIDAYRSDATEINALHLHEAAEPRRQELIRRLNQAPGGTSALVHMREDIFRHERAMPELRALDADFRHLFSSWFNRGFLVLRPIDWNTPANILEKIIRYEAVHAIQNWEDLRGRIEPPDRRCFAFFHPRLVDEPLIFVEVALTQEIPDAIAPLLAPTRRAIKASDATTAVFYSISNCQKGLRGISFGNFLIKQVVEELRRELPKLTAFVTLSPVPDFARWLSGELASDVSILPQDVRDALAELKGETPPELPETLRRPMLSAAALYFTQAKAAGNQPRDSVARFHLGNGARLERINWQGDMSEKGVAQGYGLMVNYLYELDDIEENHEAFADRGEIIVGSEVRQHLRRRGGARQAEKQPEKVVEKPAPEAAAE
ncbi:MAG: Malonyl-CoA decarboxylase [Hyphomicrobiales bacterium]|jgi:malonyl-CoA decarboxylase|nr:Malonyl-CoA decarboxylase [Hyphomicrobiales bacterium]